VVTFGVMAWVSWAWRPLDLPQLSVRVNVIRCLIFAIGPGAALVASPSCRCQSFQDPLAYDCAPQMTARAFTVLFELPLHQYRHALLPTKLTH
jgi:hypothetical protein